MLRVLVSLFIILSVFSCAAETKRNSYNHIDGEGKYTKENFILPATIDTTMLYQGGNIICRKMYGVPQKR